MNTIREEIILEIIARAAVIRTTGSPQAYATEIGETIFRARKNLDPEDPPCTVVWPQVETAENVYGKTRHKMTVKIEGFAAFGSSDPSVVAEKILGDLIKCFTSPAWDRRRVVAGSSPATYLNPYAESITYQGGGVESPLEEGSTFAGNQATFLITYDTAVGDPYNK